ncbi:MAG TPA: response regulator transcription factor [Candidatus Pelethocola excrementipullorum]|nr:response regulator transcription factor [Candidatus Pelethocola excrementipullorum]
MKTILIIEDDTELACGIKEILCDCCGYDVFMAHSKKDALVQLKNKHVDLCLLDIRLPDGNGYDLCRKMREFYQGGVIMLTACTNTEQIVEGLQAGADDYVTKPFQIAELLARIEAQFRRGYGNNEMVPKTAFSGELEIMMDQHHIYKNEKLVDLSIREYMICELLLEQRGRIVTRDVLLENIWDSRNKYVEEGTLNVHISRIRKKLGSYEGLSYIETIKGFGYRWAHQVIQN